MLAHGRLQLERLEAPDEERRVALPRSAERLDPLARVQLCAVERRRLAVGQEQVQDVFQLLLPLE